MEIPENNFLEAIKLDNHQAFYNLMWRIYPTEYAHFWKNEDCNFYINNQFSKETLSKELDEEKQLYFFVVDKGEYVGVLRLKFDEYPKKLTDKKCIKLHRIYLDAKVQGKGLGTKISQFIDEVTKLNGYEFIWLNAMEKKRNAIQFYLKNGYQVFDEYPYDFNLLKEEYQQMLAMYKEV